MVILGFIFSLHSDRCDVDLSWVWNIPLFVSFILRAVVDDGETKALANGVMITRVANVKQVFETILLFTFVLRLSGSMVRYILDL